MAIRRSHLLFFLLFLFGLGQGLNAQNRIYTARGYWEETNQQNYQLIKQKIEHSDSVSVKEEEYLKDFEGYLKIYYERMPDAERQEYASHKAQWDIERSSHPTPAISTEEFDLRGRDRLTNGIYGLYYGISLSVVSNLESPASVGVPLITTGLWVMGPAINRKKYEGITRPVIRAANTGKLLGLINGLALGLAISGSETSDKLALGLSTFGSIALGEAAFQFEKRRNFSPGRIELIRHYALLGPWVASLLYGSTGSIDSRIFGAAVLGGSISGMVIGNMAATKYDYTRGDVDGIRSLTAITAGLGLAAVAGSDSPSLLIVPAATSIAGTIIGHRVVRGAHLTDQQGSTINLASGGTALIGLGILAIAKTTSPAIWFGVPSAMALITNQVLLHDFKMKNLEANIGRGRFKNHCYYVSLRVTPEGYFINKFIPARDFSPQTYARLQASVIKINLTF